MKRKITHWVLYPTSFRTFCGRFTNGVSFHSSIKKYVTCESCRNLMKLHKYLPESTNV
jgi:LSD1 subclass zinc finger protein